MEFINVQAIVGVATVGVQCNISFPTIQQMNDYIATYMYPHALIS